MRRKPIKHRFTGELLCNGIPLDIIIKNHEKWLRGEKGGLRANLSDADLYGANLSDANLYGGAVKAYGYEFTKLPILLSDKYRIEIWQGLMKIGCEVHTLDEWKSFTQKRIIEMDCKRAAQWWKKWKPALFALAEAGEMLELPEQNKKG